ncbi:unnamed protein product [Pedinophyceae sp. YPF-701]|nr:unnamed protein product [Pedinophyceae sp. YPF-701]
MKSVASPATCLAGPRALTRQHTRHAVSPRRAAVRARAAKGDTVIPDPDFRLPAALGALAGVSFATGNNAGGGVFGLLGAFLALQATRVKFRFEKDALEVVIGEEQEESENAFVGGQNRWKYDSFVNWELWWPGFPVLVYFKETQTKPEGQIHFFPVIFNGKQLYETMVERCGPSQNSAPKE